MTRALAGAGMFILAARRAPFPFGAGWSNERLVGLDLDAGEGAVRGLSLQGHEKQRARRRPRPGPDRPARPREEG